MFIKIFRFFPMMMVAFIVMALVMLGIAVNVAQADQTFIVNNITDSSDIALSDGICDVDNTTTGEQCTLRAAIENVNASAGTHIIHFNLPSGIQEIKPLSRFDKILNPVTIDTVSRRDIVLDGTNAGADSPGLWITAGNSTVRGLVIYRFNKSGILLETGGGSTIEGNYIGTAVSGMSAVPNQGSGIEISNSANNRIGGRREVLDGPCIGKCNLISGNGGAGVAISGSGSTGNQVFGNFIGTNATGKAKVGNANAGVTITSAAIANSAASGNTIGGTNAGEGNIISGNGFDGIDLIRESKDNIIIGNFIGTDVTGMEKIPNNPRGIFISESSAIVSEGRQQRNEILSPATTAMESRSPSAPQKIQ